MSLKKTLTIAIVSDAIYPYNKGGKEKRIYEFSTRLVNRGYDVHIYCMNWWNAERDRIENGVHLHAICPYIPLYSGRRRSIRQAVLFGLACLQLIKEDFDVIEVDHMPYFPLFSVRLICWLKGKKMTATWHEVWGRKYWMEYLGKLGFFAYLLEKISVILPDKIISISEHTTKRIKDYFGRSKNVFTIPMGIDLKRIQKIKPSKKHSDLIFAGRLLKHKNVDLLIKSVALLRKKFPNTKCLIVGDGPEKINLEKLVKDLRLINNVEFIGFLKDHDEVYSLMKSSKVFVLPSTREGFGIVVIEAYACGLPVITVDHPDNAAKEIVLKKSRSNVIRLNKVLLAKKINYHITRPKKSDKFNIDSYTWKKIIDMTINYY